MKKANIAIIVIILISFIAAFYFYPRMPERMASHWNTHEEVDGYMSRFWGLFLMPVISVVVFLLFISIPKIDPLKANIEKFRKYFDLFILLIMLFFFYMYILTLLWNLGRRFNMLSLMIPAMGLLFFYAGVLVSKAKRNWFIGIRTPWTLSSDRVWDKTHRIGGMLFKIAGLIALLGIIFPMYAIWLVLVPIILVAIYTVIYSYAVYKKEPGKEKK